MYDHVRMINITLYGRVIYLFRMTGLQCTDHKFFTVRSSFFHHTDFIISVRMTCARPNGRHHYQYTDQVRMLFKSEKPLWSEGCASPYMVQVRRVYNLRSERATQYTASPKAVKNLQPSDLATSEGCKSYLAMKSCNLALKEERKKHNEIVNKHPFSPLSRCKNPKQITFPGG